MMRVKSRKVAIHWVAALSAFVINNERCLWHEPIRFLWKSDANWHDHEAESASVDQYTWKTEDEALEFVKLNADVS